MILPLDPQYSGRPHILIEQYRTAVRNNDNIIVNFMQVLKLGARAMRSEGGWAARCSWKSDSILG